jgi:hypothetical protein
VILIGTLQQGCTRDKLNFEMKDEREICSIKYVWDGAAFVIIKKQAYFKINNFNNLEDSKK